MKKLMFSFLFILLTGAMYCQTSSLPEVKSTTDTIQEEYLTIVFTGIFINTQKAYISINGEKFETAILTSKGNYNYNELLKLMKKYNEKGWVLKNSNLSLNENGSDYLFVLMSRKKDKKRPDPDQDY